jgi:thiol-disulfide isomerase/thioredoxin
MIKACSSAVVICALGLATVASAFAAVPAPQIHEELTGVPAAPYDEMADAHAQVAAAIARAGQSHKLVLLDFGGNWCPDCRVTAGVFAMPSVKPWIDQNFEVVSIDVGRMKKNLDIAARYNVAIKAVPTIILLDSNGRVINSGNPAALKDARSMTPQAIINTIHDWIEP